MNDQENSLKYDRHGGLIRNVIFIQAVKEKASEIYIEPKKDKLKISMLIDDIAHEVMEVPFAVRPFLMKHLKLMANLEIDKCNIIQHGIVEIIVEGKTFFMDIATAPTEYGEKAVIKISEINDHDENVE